MASAASGQGACVPAQSVAGRTQACPHADAYRERHFYCCFSQPNESLSLPFLTFPSHRRKKWAHTASFSDYRKWYQEQKKILLFGKIQGCHFRVHVCEVIQVDAVSTEMPASLVCRDKGVRSEHRSSRNHPGLWALPERAFTHSVPAGSQVPKVAPKPHW